MSGVGICVTSEAPSAQSKPFCGSATLSQHRFQADLHVPLQWPWQKGPTGEQNPRLEIHAFTKTDRSRGR